MVKIHRKIIRLLFFIALAFFPVCIIHQANATPKSKVTKQKASAKSTLNKSLFTAIDNNDLHAVQTLLTRGADVRARNDYQMTPLMVALNNCDSSNVPFKIIEALLAKKADVNAKDQSGDSVLVYAVNSGSDAAVKLLLQHGANANNADQYGNTILSNAIDHSGPEVIKTLLNAGAKAAGELPLLALRSDDTSLAQLFIKHGANVNESTALEKTPLMFAASQGHLNMLKFLLKNGAKVNAKSPTEGSTALMETIPYGQIEAAKLLLQAGADPNAQDVGGTSVLDKAVMSRSDPAFVQLLLDHGMIASPDSMAQAATWGELKMVELLLAHGAGKNISEQSLASALTGVLIFGNTQSVRRGLYGYAATLTDKEKAEDIANAEADDTAIVKDLLGLGVDVRKSPYNRALTFAAYGGVAPIVRMLLDKGAAVDGGGSTQPATDLDNFNARLAAEITPGNMTPLMAAAAGGHAEVCRMLLDAGANPHLTNANGQTAMMLLAQIGRNKIAEDLPRLRVNVLHRADEGADKPTSRDVTPSEAAAMQQWADAGDTAIVKALIAKKADLQARDKDKQTALMLAVKNSSAAVVQTLIKAGADVNAKDAAGQNTLMQVVEKGHISRAPQLFSFELQRGVEDIKRNPSLFNTPDGKKIAANTKAAAAKQQAEVIQRAIAQDVAIIKVLLSAGVDLNVKDSKGQTALQMAKQLHHAAIVTLLEKAKPKTANP
jgi:ankyrin repeat protein